MGTRDVFLKLPHEGRHSIVVSFRELGLTKFEIAEFIGVREATVSRAMAGCKPHKYAPRYFSDAQVWAIREAYENLGGKTLGAAAKELGVSTTTLYQIGIRLRYKNVPELGC